MVCQPSACTNALSSGNDSFDVETAITGLLADPKKDSLELPCFLSAEQRKHAKKTIEQRQDLKCESFGMGADRRMYVFKNKPAENRASDCINEIAECSPNSVSVKNTFIDDWIPADAVPADQRNVQSMPHNMFGKRLAAEHSAATSAANFSAPSPVNEEAASTSFCTGGEPVLEEYSYAVGTEVVIDGLVKAPVFNGALGTVHSWDAEAMRYNVFLAFETTSGQRWAKVKGENLNLVSPAPPPTDANAYLIH